MNQREERSWNETVVDTLKISATVILKLAFRMKQLEQTQSVSITTPIAKRRKDDLPFINILCCRPRKLNFL